jgi:hypothetical protein
MCKPKATADATLPAVIGAVVLVSAVGSAAAAVITSILVAVLTAVGVLSAIGVVTLVVLLRRDQKGLWQPAGRRAVARPVTTRPVVTGAALPAPRATAAPPASPVPALLAIEAPKAVPDTAELAGAVLSAEEELISARI